MPRSPLQGPAGGQEAAPVAGSHYQGAGWAAALGSRASRGPTDTNSFINYRVEQAHCLNV